MTQMTMCNSNCDTVSEKTHRELSQTLQFPSALNSFLASLSLLFSFSGPEILLSSAFSCFKWKSSNRPTVRHFPASSSRQKRDVF